MSSKTKTTNLGLSQWELDDVFQMDDFNQDNAKIDAAMGLLTESLAGGLAGNLKLELIKEVTEKSGSSTPISLEMSSLDLGKYFCFIIHVPCTDKTSFCMDNTNFGSFEGQFYCIGFPFKDGSTSAFMVLNSSSESISKEVKSSSGLTDTFSNLGRLLMVSSYTRKRDTKVNFWGIK